MQPLKQSAPMPVPFTSTTTSTSTTPTTTTTTTTTLTTPARQVSPGAPRVQVRTPSRQSAWARDMLNEERSGVPPLHQAILQADFEIAKVLLKSGASVKKEIRPPLSLNDAITAPLFSLGRPVKFRKTHGKGAADKRERCIVDLATAMKAAAPEWDIRNTGANALTLALLHNAPLKFVKHLLTVAKKQYSAIANQADAAGRTPMMIAIERGDHELISLLLQNGACAGSPTHLEAALDHCVLAGQPQLLKQIAQISETGTQTLFRVVQRRSEMLLAGDSTVLRRLLEAVHPILSDDHIVALLVTAIQTRGTKEKLSALYDFLRSPMTGSQLETLRQAAVKVGDLANYRHFRQLDKLLVEALNSSDAAKSPLLHRELVRALHINDQDFVDILINKGLDTFFDEDDYGQATSEEAFIRMLMVDRRVQEEPESCADLLSSATRRNYAACVDYLLGKHTPTHDRLLDGIPSLEMFQPIAIAIRNENLEIAQALLRAGAIPSSRIADGARFTKNQEFRELFQKFW